MTESDPMSVWSLHYANNYLQGKYGDGEEVGLSVEKMWSLSEAVRTWTFSNAVTLEHPPHKTIRKNNAVFDVVVSDHLPFWRRLEKGKWEPGTFTVLDQLLTTDSVYFDIGTWIGPTLMYAAHKADICYGFEPDPLAFRELECNLKLNAHTAWAKNILIENKAVSNQNGSIVLSSRGEGGDSMSSTILNRSESQQHWNVETTDLVAALSPLAGKNRHVLLKIDIEGGEYELLPAVSGRLKDSGCDICLSLHPEIYLKSISPDISDGVSSRLRARIKLALMHWHIYRMMPHRPRTKDGRRIWIFREICKCLSGVKPEKDWVSAKIWSSGN